METIRPIFKGIGMNASTRRNSPRPVYKWLEISEECISECEALGHAESLLGGKKESHYKID